MKRARILIVGAGPAGLATARALTAGGFAPHVVERDSAWTNAGSGMFLPANAFRALRALKLDNAVAARAFRIRTQRLLDQRGRVLVEIDLAHMWGDVGPCLGIARAQLHDVLRNGVPVELGTTVRSLEQENGGPVLAGFADGRSSEYDLVVGADGIHSTVRRLVGDDRPPVPVGQRSWRFLTTCPTDVDVWTVLLGRSCSFLMVPLGGGLLYCYADVTAEPAADENLEGDPRTELRRRFDAFAAPVPAILDRLPDASEVHESFIEEVAALSWGAGPSCSSGMRHTECRRTWRKEPPLPSRTPWSWLRACAVRGRSTTVWPNSRLAETSARVGFGLRPTVVTALATFLHSFGI